MSGVCKKCGGSGWLLRPTTARTINFRRCRSCPVIPPKLIGKRGHAQPEPPSPNNSEDHP